jgi:5-methylcytosine-specific restriction endonuclease McrA
MIRMGSPEPRVSVEPTLNGIAEHLKARSEGGNDHPENIVAACQFCNQTRHKRKQPLAPEEYRRMIHRRLAQGRWHSLRPRGNTGKAGAE